MKDTLSGFGEVLKERARSQGTREAFIFLDHHGQPATRRSYGELDEAARRIGAALAARRLAGKPVLLIFPSGIEFIEALFGCFYAGSIAVPAPYVTDNQRGLERLCAIAADCRPAGVLVSASLAEAKDSVVPVLAQSATEIIRTDRLGGDDGADWQPRAADPEAIALLQYTSGSSRAPRGVMLTHANLLANSTMIGNAMGHGPDLRGVGWLPLFHDMGLIGHVLHPVHAGGLSVLMDPMTFMQRPWLWLKAISDWKAQTSGAPCNAYDLCTRLVPPRRMTDLDLSSWRVAYCGAERVRPEVLERFAEKFASCGFRREALYACYGLAEATLMVSGPAPGAGLCVRDPGAGGRQRVASCGMPVAPACVAIIDPDSGQPSPEGSAGEIWVAGPAIGRGYWERPEETRETFSQVLNGTAGWLRTGDLGFMAEGELVVVGRLKSLIIIRGVNHAAEDIEATVAASHGQFARLAQAAFSVDADGEEQAVVVQEIRGAGDCDAAAQAAFAAVTREHGLRLFDLVLVRPGTIPRTSSGKVQRHSARRLYEDERLERLVPAARMGGLGISRRRREAVETGP